jgi:hypothetical protein
LGGLRDLRFEYVELRGEVMRALMRAPCLPQLKRLSIFGGMLGPEEGREVLSCRALSGLRTLELSCNFALTHAVAEHVESARHLTGLVDLRLNWVQGGDQLAEAVARSPHLAGLANLELANNYVSAKGVKALGESPHLGRLCRLRLFEWPYGPYQRLLGGPPRETFRLTREAAQALSGLTNLGCVELHGYDCPADSFAPLLALGRRAWVTAEPERIADGVARSLFQGRLQKRWWLPPLDEYQEEEEPHP